MAKRFALPLLAAALLLGAAGCTSDDDEPLPGTYRSTEFRLQTDDGAVVDVDDAGGRLELVLGDDGRVESGFLVTPGLACALLTGEACPGGAGLMLDLAGSYTRDGDALTFDLNGNSFVEDVRWNYDGNDGILRAGAVLRERGIRDYVVFLEKQDDDG